MAEKTKVTRITAKAKKPSVKRKDGDVKPKERPEGKKTVFSRIKGYFKGAWVELRQVRWPTRKATWGLTLGVTLFSAFFVAVILLLDGLFQYLFDLIIN